MTTDYDNAWQRWMTDYNEGLGLVYERLLLNDFLDGLVERFGIRTVLEAPIYGMAGATGLNSVRFAQRGVHVTLVDVNAERLREVRRLWDELGLLDRVTFVCVPEPALFPFGSNSFDLVWNWAALWHLPAADATLGEMARVTGNLLFTAMPNRFQMGYLLRKWVLEPEFFGWVRDERWADIGRVRAVLEGAGLRLIEQGVLDVPPWPDTVMPASEVLARLGLGQRAQARFQGDGWAWSTMAYYRGEKPEYRTMMDQYALLERAPLPWQLKAIWAHHRFLLLQKQP